MAAQSIRPYEEVKKDLRQLFMDRGWGIEIEGETLPYYNVYEAMSRFIQQQFYGGIIEYPIIKEIPKIAKIERIIKKPKVIEKSTAGYVKCKKCGKKRAYYRAHDKNFKCRECGSEF